MWPHSRIPTSATSFRPVYYKLAWTTSTPCPVGLYARTAFIPNHVALLSHWRLYLWNPYMLKTFYFFYLFIKTRLLTFFERVLFSSVHKKFFCSNKSTNFWDKTTFKWWFNIEILWRRAITLKRCYTHTHTPTHTHTHTYTRTHTHTHTLIRQKFYSRIFSFGFNNFVHLSSTFFLLNVFQLFCYFNKKNCVLRFFILGINVFYIYDGTNFLPWMTCSYIAGPLCVLSAYFFWILSCWEPGTKLI